MTMLLQRFLFSLLFISCLQAIQTVPTTLPIPTFSTKRERLLLNPAKNDLQLYETSAGEDLWNRTVWGAAAGMLTGFTLGATVPRLTAGNADLILFCGLTVPILSLTFIPGSTEYDHAGLTDWLLISLGRNTVASIGGIAGVMAGIIPGVFFAGLINSR
ncbi:hypothetical protein M1466_03305 [Candidatus Dependentiae bacterium]|nr:hypothetical protein [Candidatus Dependentiae bacterium]